MVLDHVLNWLSADVGVAITGRSVLMQRRGSSEVIDLPNQYPVLPPKPPPARLPAEVREGLSTRKHERDFPCERPVTQEGWISNVNGAEVLLARGLREVLGRWDFIGPRVVVTTRFGDSAMQKRTVVDLLERARARRVYLTDYPMTCAIGLRLDVVRGDVVGLLALESDWFEFAAISYADNLISVSQSVGVEHLFDDVQWFLSDSTGLAVEREQLVAHLKTSGIRAGELRFAEIEDDGRRGSQTTRRLGGEELSAGATPTIIRIAENVRSALDDLKDAQYQALKATGIHLCGEGASILGLSESLAERLGIPVFPVAPPIHPAVAGLSVYLNHLDEWKYMLSRDFEASADDS